jgi:hypothetical protein
VERGHEQLARPLAEWMLGGERDELGEVVAGGITVLTESGERHEPLLARGDRELGEASCLDATGIGVGELLVGLPTPKSERFIEHHERSSRVARTCRERIGDERAEAVRIDVIRLGPEPVAGSDGLDRSLGKHAPQPEDVRLQCRRLVGRQPFGPKQLGETVGADHRPALEHESREQPALPISRRREVSVAFSDAKGSKHPIPHCPPPRIRSVSGSRDRTERAGSVHPDRMQAATARHGRLGT